MKTIFYLMVAILIVSLALLCASIMSGDVITFAFSTGLSIVSVLGACVVAGVLDDRRV